MAILNRRYCRSARGFTLAEILVAMLITSIIAMGLNAAYNQAFMIFKGVQQPRHAYQCARDFTETIRNELAGVYTVKVDAGKGDTREQLPGIFSLKVLAQGETELSFFTVTPCWSAGLHASRPARVRYIFGIDSGRAVVIRKQQLCAGNKAIAQETSDRIFTSLVDFKVQVADPNANNEIVWTDSFSARDKLPKAIKFDLKWPGQSEQDSIDFEVVLGIACKVIKKDTKEN